MTLEDEARWVKDRHKTPGPENHAFSRVVPRESARVELIYSSLKSYLSAPVTFKMLTFKKPILRNTMLFAVQSLD